MCTCDAGAIGAPHCEKCEGKGFTKIIRVNEVVSPNGRVHKYEQDV